MRACFSPNSARHCAPLSATPQTFAKTKINPGFDGAVAAMRPGERLVVIVPASLAYGRAGLYPPEVAVRRRFVVSPNALLVYEVEAE